MIYQCYLCYNEDESTDGKMPDHWRRAWRGYAGYCYICPECNIAKRNYHKDIKDMKKNKPINHEEIVAQPYYLYPDIIKLDIKDANTPN